MEPELIHMTAIGYFDAGEQPELMQKVYEAWGIESEETRTLWEAGKVKLVIPLKVWETIFTTSSRQRFPSRQ